MKCCCKKMNGYIISKCCYHYDKRQTIFQLYKKVRLELAALKASGAPAEQTGNNARVKICGNNVCEYCAKHGKCFGTQHFPKCFVGRKLSPVA